MLKYSKDKIQTIGDTAEYRSINDVRYCHARLTPLEAQH